MSDSKADNPVECSACERLMNKLAGCTYLDCPKPQRDNYTLAELILDGLLPDQLAALARLIDDTFDDSGWYDDDGDDYMIIYQGFKSFYNSKEAAYRQLAAALVDEVKDGQFDNKDWRAAINVS